MDTLFTSLISNMNTFAYFQGLITGLFLAIVVVAYYWKLYRHPGFDQPDESTVAKEYDNISDSEECKMVLLIRVDLNMSKGKVAAQCCHAALAAYQQAVKIQRSKLWVDNWEYHGQAKITLKCPDEETMYYVLIQVEDTERGSDGFIGRSEYFRCRQNSNRSRFQDSPGYRSRY
jgi:hypothetical protein